MSAGATATAWATAAAVRAGEVSAEAVTAEALARIDRHDRGVNAWLRVDADGALTAARAIDAARARGEPLGPLAGVPAGLKDSIVTAGIETTAGSRILEGWIPPEDGAQAECLRAAGAVILGKLAQDEFGMGASNENTPYAAVHNPWAQGYVPGGSSGGSAAAVAARTACFSLGSDTGGSIRQPASLCGVVGLRPTYGRVSRRGLIAFASSLDTVGPLTRDVRDAALVLACLAGHDPGDSSSLRAPVPDYLAAVELGRREGLAGLRIGVERGAIVEAALDPAVAGAFTAALAVLVDAGATLVELALPYSGYAVATYHAIANSEAQSNLARLDGVRYGPRAGGADFMASVRASRTAGFGAEVQRRLLLGAFAQRETQRESLYERAQRVRQRIVAEHAEAFAGCDLLASPAARLPGFRLGERTEDPVAMMLSDRFVIAASVAGLPAMCVPAGLSAATPARPRLPIGLHLVAPWLGEENLLRAGAAHEARTCWHEACPPGVLA